jgi:hypothetical protein
MKQTAVEWLIDMLITENEVTLKGENFKLFEMAIAMEKEQIMNAWIATDNELQRIAAEQYYNETFNDGLENEPYISDNFQIGPDGAYEHTEEWNTLPKKKAKELVNKFSNECLLTEDGGKVAALLAVEEILNTIEYSSQSDELSKVNYWIEVKKEIEKL